GPRRRPVQDGALWPDPQRVALERSHAVDDQRVAVDGTRRPHEAHARLRKEVAAASPADALHHDLARLEGGNDRYRMGRIAVAGREQVGEPITGERLAKLSHFDGNAHGDLPGR